MKNLAQLTLCALLLMTLTSNAQDSTRKESKTGTYLKYNLGALFDPVAPTFFFSAEFRTREKFGFEIGAGLPNALFDVEGDSVRRRGYKLKTTFRFYPTGGKGYLGLELFGTSARHNKYNGHFVAESGEDFTYAQAEVRRNIIGLAFKGGGIFPIGDRWFLETGGGLGFRFVNSSINPQNGSIREQHNSGGIPEAVEGYKTTPHINMDLKIAYRL
jgi:hypothetical protein